MTTTPLCRRLHKPSSEEKTMSSSEHGRVRPGTKDCRSHSRSESSGDPTQYKQCWSLLLHRPAARDNAACKSYALRPVLRPCLAVGRRRCHSPKAGVGELHKAAAEASFIGPSGHRCPLHINSCKTSEEVVPGAQCVRIGGYICRSPPPACQYTEGVPPPALRSGEKCDCPRRLSGRYCLLKN
jgi:hypothetical protein